MYQKFFSVLITSLLLIAPISNAQQRWSLNKNSGISWEINQALPHNDHIEMSGKQVSVVFRYGVNSQGAFHMNKSIVWPMLRTIPNNTNASLMRTFNWNPLDQVIVNGRSLTNEQVERVHLKGMLTVESSFAGSLGVVREYLPATDLPAIIENYCIINKGKKSITIELPFYSSILQTDPSKGVEGSYQITSRTDKQGSFILQAGDTLKFTAHTAGYKTGVTSPPIDGATEKLKRSERVDQWMNNLVLETPDATINRMFAFSKIRACESIYQTKGGPLHGPGGEAYYAAIWANDQAEYINPFFPFTGYAYGNESALNSFRHFARFMNTDWNPIPSSIIAEGLDIWNGAGDRGDAAMIAYGASRYALARGSHKEALELWPLIDWCLEYCQRKLNGKGVVASDSDELEGRFPSGKANLCTSSLYYDALVSASYLCNEMKMGKKAAVYRKQAATLRKNIELYFGANVEGFDTYAYYEGNDVLRSWICIPLTVGINERANATIDALFSKRLWTADGLLTQAGSKTFWDRSTLYALRGVYEVGETKKATEFLSYYSQKRLLGEHVPYAIEAWPEGGQRHLSAESALYGRIITEGMFGIRPTGLKSFIISPRLPEEWDQMALRRIHAFDTVFDIEIKRLANCRLEVTMIEGKKVKTKIIKENTSFTLSLS